MFDCLTSPPRRSASNSLVLLQPRSSLAFLAASDLADVQHRLRAPSLGASRHVRSEAFIQPKADAVQLGWGGLKGTCWRGFAALTRQSRAGSTALPEPRSGAATVC